MNEDIDKILPRVGFNIKRYYNDLLEILLIMSKSEPEDYLVLFHEKLPVLHEKYRGMLYLIKNEYNPVSGKYWARELGVYTGWERQGKKDKLKNENLAIYALPIKIQHILVQVLYNFSKHDTPGFHYFLHNFEIKKTTCIDIIFEILENPQGRAFTNFVNIKSIKPNNMEQRNFKHIQPASSATEAIDLIKKEHFRNLLSEFAMTVEIIDKETKKGEQQKQQNESSKYRADNPFYLLQFVVPQLLKHIYHVRDIHKELEIVDERNEYDDKQKKSQLSTKKDFPITLYKTSKAFENKELKPGKDNRILQGLEKNKQVKWNEEYDTYDFEAMNMFEVIFITTHIMYNLYLKYFTGFFGNHSQWKISKAEKKNLFMSIYGGQIIPEGNESEETSKLIDNNRSLFMKNRAALYYLNKKMKDKWLAHLNEFNELAMQVLK